MTPGGTTISPGPVAPAPTAPGGVTRRGTSARMNAIAWATVGLYVLVAVCLTHMPHVPREIELGSDKILHSVGYFLYAGLIYIAAGLTFPRFRPLALVVTLGLGLWAAADEITQPYFGRDCDIMDWRADMIGVIAAVVVLSLLRFAGRQLERRAAANKVAEGVG